MLGGYRRYILAAVGWLILSAANQPKESAHADQTAARSELSNAANTISAAIANAAKPSEKDRGCGQDQDERSSDLCAQWKAADAARDAANYAFWGIWIGLFGTALIVATFWETRRTARSQLRAYISLKSGGIGTLFAAQKPLFSGELINTGQTPAKKFECVCDIVFRKRDWCATIVDPDDWGGRSDLGPGQSFSLRAGLEIPLTLEMLKSIEIGESRLFVSVCGRFEDVFGRKHRFTFAAFMRHTDGGLQPCPWGNEST